MNEAEDALLLGIFTSLTLTSWPVIELVAKLKKDILQSSFKNSIEVTKRDFSKRTAT